MPGIFVPLYSFRSQPEKIDRYQENEGAGMLGRSIENTLKFSAVILLLTSCAKPPSDTSGLDSNFNKDSGTTSKNKVTPATASPDTGTQTVISASNSPAGGGGPTGGNGNNISAASWFAADMFFNQSIQNAAVDPLSSTILSQLRWPTGVIKIDFSIDYYIADSNAVRLAYMDNTGAPMADADYPAFVPTPSTGAAGFESDNGPLTDGGDDHYLVIDPQNHQLIELYQGYISTLNGVRTLLADGGAFIWDLKKTYPANLRGDVCTSADGGGLPVAPLVFSAEEVAAGHIDHAIRFAVQNSQMQCGMYVRPTTHAGNGGACTSGIPYGARLRLRADYPVNNLPSVGAQVVARTLQKFGMILTDGANYDALMAKRDTSSTQKWTSPNSLLGANDLNALQTTDFDMINAGPRISVGGFDCVRTP